MRSLSYSGTILSGLVGRLPGCDCCVTMRLFLSDISTLEGATSPPADMDDCSVGGAGVLVFSAGFGLECFEKMNLLKFIKQTFNQKYEFK